jgi:hydroxymethylbilane synthase
VLELTAPLAHAPTCDCVNIERGIMEAMDGGCQTPFAAHARYNDAGSIEVHSMVASVDGQTMLKAAATGSHAQPLIQDVTEQLLSQGALAIMQQAREAS